MRNFITTFIIIILLQIIASSQCPSGRIELYNQAAIDQFAIDYPNCTEITGDLWIKGSTVNNLNGLRKINSVEGSLTITQTSLMDMIGFNGLKTVGYLAIGGNAKLTNLAGLEGLVRADHVGINYNPLLLNLRGLESLVQVTERIELTNNPKIKNLIHLNDQIQVGEIKIVSNVGLEEIVGFNQQDLIKGSVELRDLTALTKLRILSQTTKIGRSLSILACDNLGSIEGWENIEEVKNLVISGCLSMPVLPTMQKLKTLEAYNISENIKINDLKPIRLPAKVNWVQIASNDNLASIEGLETLEEVETDFLLLSGNYALKSLKGLDNLRKVGNRISIATDFNLFVIDGFPKLIEAKAIDIQSVTIRKITGLTALTTVSDSLRIWCRRLQRMDGLINLKQVLGKLYVFSDSLETLYGLDNIDPRGLTNVVISNSKSLNYCSVPSICTYLSQNIGPYTIGFNKAGCNNAAEILAGCSTVATADVDNDQQWAIYPNPFNDELHLGTDLAKASIRIYDGQGRAITLEKDDEIIYTHTWPSGLYIVQYANDNKLSYQKVVKE